MRHAHRLLFLACLLIVPAPGHAGAAREGPASGPAVRNLSLTESDPAALIAQARRLPAVQTTMRAFAARGYVARPQYDAAARPAPGENAMVVLAYEKPGYVPPDHSIGAPVITVATGRIDGVPTTVVEGAFVVIDTLYKAFSVAVDGRDDPICGHGADYTLTTHEKAILITYVACAGTGNVVCLASTIALWVMGPGAYAAGATACIMLNTGRCLTSAIGEWFDTGIR